MHRESKLGIRKDGLVDGGFPLTGRDSADMVAKHRVNAVRGLDPGCNGDQARREGSDG